MEDAQREALERELAQWAQQRRALDADSDVLDADRDVLVRVAVAFGIPKHRVHVITGLARTTIDRIVEGTHTG